MKCLHVSTIASACVWFCLSPAAWSAPCAEVADLLDFIAARSDYSIPDSCPPVRRRLFLQSDEGLRSQAGAYMPENGQIMLAADLDTTTALGRSYLLHELVHAAQYRDGAQTRVRCTAELEREAYALQADYLRNHGEGREALLLGWLADGLSRCPGTADPAAY